MTPYTYKSTYRTIYIPSINKTLPALFENDSMAQEYITLLLQFNAGIDENIKKELDLLKK